MSVTHAKSLSNDNGNKQNNRYNIISKKFNNLRIKKINKLEKSDPIQTGNTYYPYGYNVKIYPGAPSTMIKLSPFYKGNLGPLSLTKARFSVTPYNILYPWRQFGGSSVPSYRSFNPSKDIEFSVDPSNKNDPNNIEYNIGTNKDPTAGGYRYSEFRVKASSELMQNITNLNTEAQSVKMMYPQLPIEIKKIIVI